MNHSTAWSAPSAPMAAVRMTRSTPSAPIPARRSHRARTRSRAQLAVDGPVVVGQQHEVVLRAVSLQERVVSHAWATRPSSHGSQRPPDTFRVVVPHPHDAWVLAVPGVLPPGEPPRHHHGPLARLVERQLAVEVRRHLAVADRQAGRPPLAEPGREQSFDLLDEARLEHRLDPPRDPFDEGGPVDVDADLDGVRVGVLESRKRRGERTSGDLDDLERAYDAAAVVGPDVARGDRVDLGQSLVQHLGPPRRQIGFEPAADGLVGARELEPVEHGPRVERRPADEHGTCSRARRSAIAVRAHCWNSATVSDSETSSRSTRWCGMPRRSATGCFAVPTSMPR